MKRVAKLLIILLVSFISLYFINVYAGEDVNQKLISSVEIPIKSYELASNSQYSTYNSQVEVMSYGEKGLGSLLISGVNTDKKSYHGYNAYGVNGQITISYSYDSKYLDSKSEWHMIEDSSTTVCDTMFSSEIGLGVLILESSSDLDTWGNVDYPITDFFDSYGNGDAIFNVNSNSLKKGLFYRLTIAYSLENEDLAINKKFMEVYEFYLIDNNAGITIKDLSTGIISYSYKNAEITSFKLSSHLIDDSITTTGFRINTNGYDNHSITVKINDEEEVYASDGDEFDLPGKYIITTIGPLGDISTKTIYVYTEDINYGYSNYFIDDALIGDRVYTSDGSLAYDVNTRLYINKIVEAPNLSGTIKNISTNKITYINNTSGNTYYSLEAGDYVVSLSCGQLSSGSIIYYNFKFTITNDISKPTYNHNRFLNFTSSNILKAKHYEVAYNNVKIVFSDTNYNQAYQYAYKIESGFVENRADGIYYYSNKYSGQDELEKILKINAEERIELSYFDYSKNISIETIDDLVNNLSKLEQISSEYVVDSSNESSLYSDSLIINDFIFEYVSEYDSVFVKAYCHNNGAMYDILYDIPLSEQLSITSKYTIVEVNTYGNITEFDAFYINQNNTVINAGIEINGVESIINISNEHNSKLELDSLIINNVINQYPLDSIIKIETDAYSYSLIGEIADFVDLALYKMGNYKITSIDSLGDSFSIEVIITGNSNYKDIVVGDIYSFTDLYNRIYIKDKKLNEELKYDKVDLKRLIDNDVDINLYTFSSYSDYMECVNEANYLYLNELASIYDINAKVFELIDYYDSLVPSVDKTTLYLELNKFEGINKELYVTSSYSNYKTLYDSGIIKYKNDNISAYEINYHANLLRNSYLSLILRGNKTELQGKYIKYGGIQEDEYTPITYEAFILAYESSKRVLDYIDSTQKDVDNALAELNLRYLQLIKRADYTGLIELFTTINELKEWIYTTDSFNELDKYYDEAYNIYLEKNASQIYVNQIILQLDNLILALEPCGDDLYLHNLVIEVASLHSAIYTSETIKPLLDKCNEANIIISERHSQQVIDEYVDEIETLMTGLVIREDKEKLYYKLIEYSKLDYSSVSTTEMNRFMKVYNSAYDVLYSEDSTEEEITNTYDELVAANEKLFYELELEALSPWIIIVVSLAALLALTLANGLMKELFDCELVGLLILWIPSIIALPLLFIFTSFVGGIILLIELGIIVVCMIIGIIVDVNT